MNVPINYKNSWIIILKPPKSGSEEPRGMVLKPYK